VALLLLRPLIWDMLEGLMFGWNVHSFILSPSIISFAFSRHTSLFPAHVSQS